MRRIPTRASLMEGVRIGNVCRKLQRMCGGESPEDAWDLVQEAYCRFLEARHRAPIANEERYLKKVIKNLLPDFWRRKHERAAVLLALEEVLERLDQESQGSLAACPPAAEEPEELLKRAIERLPPRLRSAIELDMRGFSNEQIATQLGVEITTVKKHLSRARARLKSMLLQEADYADE